MRPQKLCTIRLYSTWNTWVEPGSTSWAIPFAYNKQNIGEPGQTAGQSSRHYEGQESPQLDREDTQKRPGGIVLRMTWKV